MIHRFTCSVCKRRIRWEDDFTTGYGRPPDSDRKVCFDCCANRDLDCMKTEGHSKGLPLYLTDDPDRPRCKRLTNWPGTLVFRAYYHRTGHHNMAGSRTDVWFYLTRYGGLIADRTRQAFAPLHVPTRHETVGTEFKRQPFDAQAHAVTGIVKGWRHSKSIILCAEMGTGKTMMGICAVHARADGKPYRCLVFCPDHLVGKWAREIEITLPEVTTRQITKWNQVFQLPSGKPTGAEWAIIGRNTAKLGAKWKPAFHRDGRGLLHCAECGQLLVGTGKDPLPLTEKDLSRTKKYCKAEVETVDREGKLTHRVCRAPLWQFTHELHKWAPATYIHKHMKGYFDYLIVDEVHEEKGEATAQGMAAGSLAVACGKVLALTGTLIGGYANHLRPILFRLAPQSLLQDDLGWHDGMEFLRRYGRVDTIVTERDGPDVANRQSRGSTRSKREAARPGIMPTLYGKHLIGNTVFLGLEEVADGLPGLEEIAVPIPMPVDLARAYNSLEKKLSDKVKELLRKGNKALLGTMLQALLAYPDYPFDWNEIGYVDRSDGSPDGTWVGVATPENFDKRDSFSKEKELLKIIRAERRAGRQCWVYVQFTERRPVLGRLEEFLKRSGLKVKVLRSKVQLKKREAWIAKHAPGVDVILSHPKLVETGLDLFDKEGSYNFPSLIFYETGYNLFTLRQASRRAWRISQRHDCKVFYLFYESTMQERAMELMGRKLQASLALEGKFSADGLAALADDSGSAEMELAKSLAENLDFGGADRHWKTATVPSRVPVSRANEELDFDEALRVLDSLLLDDSSLTEEPSPAITVQPQHEEFDVDAALAQLEELSLLV